ncbi:unnamed protein product [Prunus armeniaca]|nr:hypothetical protein GBA52_008360 [Prunus armeniaca]
MNQNKNRLCRKFIVLSKEICDLKETTGIDATVLVMTKDKKLYCVNGQHRFQDMRANLSNLNVSNDEIWESKSEALDSRVDKNGSQFSYNRLIGIMGQKEVLEKAPALPLVARNKASFDPTTVEATSDGGTSNVDRDGSATATVSYAHGSGLGRSRVRRAC